MLDRSDPPPPPHKVEPEHYEHLLSSKQVPYTINKYNWWHCKYQLRIRKVYEYIGLKCAFSKTFWKKSQLDLVFIKARIYKTIGYTTLTFLNFVFSLLEENFAVQTEAAIEFKTNKNKNKNRLSLLTCVLCYYFYILLFCHKSLAMTAKKFRILILYRHQ